MRQALLIALALWAAFYVSLEGLGFQMAAAIGFSAIALIAAVNCVTFLWLWYVRATPLALGMALSWAGQTALTGWWFLSGMPGKVVWLDQNPLILLFAAVHIVGGCLHIAVVQSSLGTARLSVFWWPAIIAAAVSMGVFVGR